MDKESTKEARYIMFSVSNNLYAVELLYVYRITAIDQIYPISGTKEYIPGIVKISDSIWPVTDLHIKFGEKKLRYPCHLMGILLQHRGDKACILIDEACSVFTADPDKMIPPLEKNSYVLGSMQIENRIVSFLSIDGLLE